MNVLCCSDLHITEKDSKQIEQVNELVKRYSIDVVAISGDIIDNKNINPYKELKKIGSIPIVCCLGNHEFAYRSVKDTLMYYSQNMETVNKREGVFYLDVLGHKCIDNVNFFGNVLWYDGSLKDVPSQGNLIDESWLDSTIVKFNFREENKKCVNELFSMRNHPENNDNEDCDFGKKITKNFMVTHCVPHVDLNLFSQEGSSIYNMYSGMKDIITKLPYKVDYSICGHTHRYTAKEINSCFCVNIGNDYLKNNNNIRYFIFEEV